MAASYAVCSCCGRKYQGVTYSIEGKKYCFDCYQKFVADKEILANQKKDLYNYIQSTFGVAEIPVESIHGIDRLLKAGKKIKAIQATLWYYYEFGGRQPTEYELSHIGLIVDQYYEAAKKHLDGVKALKAKNETIAIGSEPVTIKLDPNKVHGKPHNAWTPIDISKL